MDRNEKKLLEVYRKLTPENKIITLAYARVALSAQETARKFLEESALKKGSEINNAEPGGLRRDG
jgi:inosine/xanthosine triphosphate pyrophosphatase family protein